MDAISKEWRDLTQPGDHTKQAELAGVKYCSGREAASKEVYCRCRSFGVQSEKALQGNLVVVVEHLQLLVIEDQGSEATEEYWNTVKLMNPEAGGRVAMVAAGKASRENSMEGSCMSTDSSQNCSHGARCNGPEQTHMLCFRGERHWEARHGDGGGELPVEGELLVALGGVAKQFGLLRDHGHVVGVGILHCQGEESLELMGTVACKGDIICLADAGHVNGTKLDSKLGPLSQQQFGIVREFVQFIA